MKQDVLHVRMQYQNNKPQTVTARQVRVGTENILKNIINQKRKNEYFLLYQVVNLFPPCFSQFFFLHLVPNEHNAGLIRGWSVRAMRGVDSVLPCMFLSFPWEPTHWDFTTKQRAMQNNRKVLVRNTLYLTPWARQRRLTETKVCERSSKDLWFMANALLSIIYSGLTSEMDWQ